MIRESLRRIIALIKKEFITIWKDPKSRGIIIALPLMQLFVFANAITMVVKNIDVALIASANTVESRELLSRFEHSPRFRKFYYFGNRLFRIYPFRHPRHCRCRRKLQKPGIDGRSAVFRRRFRSAKRRQQSGCRHYHFV